MAWLPSSWDGCTLRAWACVSGGGGCWGEGEREGGVVCMLVSTERFVLVAAIQVVCTVAGHRHYCG